MSHPVLYACPWFEVVLIEDCPEPSVVRRFYGVKSRDWVMVLARLSDESIPLVRLRRPIVGAELIEFPSGLVDDGETPEEAARRELLEETGCVADRLVELPAIWSEAGRSTNRGHIFYAPGAEHDPKAVIDAAEYIEPLFVAEDELHRLVRAGSFLGSGHLSAYGLAVALGYLDPRAKEESVAVRARPSIPPWPSVMSLSHTRLP